MRQITGRSSFSSIVGGKGEWNKTHGTIVKGSYSEVDREDHFHYDFRYVDHEGDTVSCHWTMSQHHFGGLEREYLARLYAARENVAVY